MPNPEKTEENPCEIDFNCAGAANKSDDKNSPCEVKIEKGESPKGSKDEKQSASKSSSSVNAKNRDDEQARIIKQPCPDQYTAPTCEKERTMPPNPRQAFSKKKGKETDDETPKEDAKDACVPDPCFKALEDPKAKKDEDEKKPC
ncbi:uncharacterized protein LOC125237335 [Leguminivora glycinivorella]|uniref:uncharacterized protein LOC125237335 n=1 Tax=Leguminivora glycinivorella TaxID=1035111 RepID=UPI00200F814E|nr:uncharacterized protein LOC125237335 [Leguminivora glycinivorella]